MSVSTSADPPPGRLLRLLVRLAARALPDTTVRTRYRQEFTADLCELTRERRLRYTVGVLIRSRALRSALDNPSRSATQEADMIVMTRHTPVLCRLNLRHRWQWHTTDDGTRYLQCMRCGKDETGERGGGAGAGAAVMPHGLG